MTAWHAYNWWITSAGATANRVGGGFSPPPPTRTPPHPPRCLELVVASPAPEPDILLDTLSDWPNRFFGIRCPCVGDQFSVSGEILRHMLIEQDVVVGPVGARCSSCGQAALVFDPRLHGYDVELDHFPPEFESTATPRNFQCPACTASRFTLVARWYEGRFRGKEQDLFTFFTLIGRCTGCNTLATIATCECA